MALLEAVQSLNWLYNLFLDIEDMIWEKVESTALKSY